MYGLSSLVSFERKDDLRGEKWRQAMMRVTAF